MNDIVPVNELAKRGVAAVGGIAGGVVLFILGSLGGFLGIIAGAVTGLAGFAAFSSKDSADKFPGFIALAAGALTLAANLPFIKTLLGGAAHFFLGIGAALLLGTGVWNLIKFLKGMKSRS